MGGGSELRVLNQLFDIWLFFNSLFLSPCNVFFVLLFRRFFPLVSVPGETVGHILPLFTLLKYSPLDGKGHRQVLFMGWVWVHLYDLSSLFFSHCNVFCVFLW